MNEIKSIKCLIAPFKSIAIIGLAKNVGKTTTLNYLLSLYREKVGITSIGFDGEDYDLVYHIKKPHIYIQKGTIIATAIGTIKDCDFTIKVLETTNILTPLGHIVIVEALSDGFCRIAGPSQNSDLKNIIMKLEKYNCHKVFVDGALNRKSFSSPVITEATIIATGASVDNSISKVVKETKFIFNLLTLPQIEDDEVEIKIKGLIDKEIVLINDNFNTEILNFKSVLNNEREIIEKLNQAIKYLYINGSLTNKLIELLITSNKRRLDLNVIIRDSSKCLSNSEVFNKLASTNIRVNVLKSTKPILITYNPVSYNGIKFDNKLFKEMLQNEINLPVINVLEEEV